LIGVGAFFLALAPLVRFYVGRQLIAAPLNVYQKSNLRAENATYLDTKSWTLRKGATLTATNTTKGDSKAGDSKIAVWDSFTSIEDASTNAEIEVQRQRAVFDRRTAELRNGRGAAVGNDTSVRQTGVGLFWPIGVKKKTYQFFDTTTKRAWPATFDGQEKIHGINTYRFVQQVPPTVTDSFKPGVPASVFGMPKNQVSTLPGYDAKNNAVPADRVSQATVKVWIDPRTGATVNQDQKVTSTLRTSDGVDRVAIADLDLKMTDASQQSLVDLSNREARKIAFAKIYIPFGGGALGIVLIVIGMVLVGRRGRHRTSAAAVPAASGAGDAGAADASPPPGGESSSREPSA
jgi:hypothetical protein